MRDASPQNRAPVTFDQPRRTRLISDAGRFVVILGQYQISLLSLGKGKAKQGQQKTNTAHFSVDEAPRQVDVFIIPQSEKKKRGRTFGEMSMPATLSGSNKAKIARRVIEVLEYFDDAHPEATVMDIVRRYNRPQSSTSELLSSLVELGLLHKDPYTRSYRLTPRAALLGTSGQPEMVRDGRLMRLMDRLAAQTGLSISLIGMVGLDSQVIVWRHGARAPACTRDLFGGCKEPLARNSAGQLMLSTVSPSRCEGMLRRLNAEADAAHKFPAAEMAARIASYRDQRYLYGSTGFGSDAESLCVLVPRQPEDHPLVVSLVYGRDEKVNTESLLQSVSEAMRACLPDPQTSNIEKLQTAA